jgi:hypothetical protein
MVRRVSTTFGLVHGALTAPSSAQDPFFRHRCCALAVRTVETQGAEVPG